ncbi:MAG: thioredoxin-disulfide reductase [Anaerolineae bacterium]
MRDVVIVGSGPAGLAAAIYAARAKRQPLVVVGEALGGKLQLISEIENYPGFPTGIAGPDLANLMVQQAQRFGAEFLSDTARAVSQSGSHLLVAAGDGSIEARTVILATGTSWRRLGVPGEEELTGRGVSVCATCDGFFFRDRVVAVIGGGSSAAEEALALTRFARKVYLIHDAPQLRAEMVLQDRLRDEPRVQVLLDRRVERIIGEQSVTGVELRDLGTAATEQLAVDGVFVYIGKAPNSALVPATVQRDPDGYVLADDYGHTSLAGFFAAGEVRRGTPGQVVTAAGSGAAAAMGAEQYLSEMASATAAAGR